jgi:hypothetical protein
MHALARQPLRKGPDATKKKDASHVGTLPKGVVVSVLEQRRDPEGVLRLCVKVLGKKSKLAGWVRHSDKQGMLFEGARR